MLIKEYRIPLPLSVEEYRIAQLYMIAKKSRTESEDQGSGVEIIENEPYTDENNKKGQYTVKHYYVAKHLPSWMKKLVPSSTLTVKEEAWNTYPYTKTIYSCPFFSTLSIEIETYYFDNPLKENVFNLSEDELKNCAIQVIDIAKDKLAPSEYNKDEDPLFYVSQKTKRGPLTENWLQEYTDEYKTAIQNGKIPERKMMCAYKLCRISFNVWALSKRVEKFIDDFAYRKIMVPAHKQAWVWQDEWYGLTIENIREIEKETQRLLSQKMNEPRKSRGSIDVRELHSNRRKESNRRSSSIKNQNLIDNDLKIASWRIEKIANESDESDAYYDAKESIDANSLCKWSSLEYVNKLDDDNLSTEELSNLGANKLSICRSPNSLSRESLSTNANTKCKYSALIFVLHGGHLLDTGNEFNSKYSDFSTLKTTFEQVIRTSYSYLNDKLVFKLVCCPFICKSSLQFLSKLSNSYQSSNGKFDYETIPIDCLPLFATNQQEYLSQIDKTINSINQVYAEFLETESEFVGRIMFICDFLGGILAYDSLCNSEQQNECKYNFQLDDLFLFGSPLSLVLAYRKLTANIPISKPQCSQVYNLYHLQDRLVMRIEPLIESKFSDISSISVPKYTKKHLMQQIISLRKHLKYNQNLFNDQHDENSECNEEDVDLHLQNLIQNWWGKNRIDYELYAPHGLNNFPNNTLPIIFHSSYWESNDVASFVLDKIMNEIDPDHYCKAQKLEDKLINKPKEKWLKKSTSLKIRNVSSNHRANDVIIKEGQEQILVARFMYGPLDVVTLAGEKVDIYLMKDLNKDDWTFLGTELTDKTGRVHHKINDRLNCGVYPVKMIVRGDHTSIDFFLTVLPPQTECVVFSIDGSFTSSISVSGKDPKVRPGSVDVVRFWQELGYLIIYITGRPGFQQSRVLAWLSEHNFPHGLIYFTNELTTDPLKHKAIYLEKLQKDVEISIHAAYGSKKDIWIYQALGLIRDNIFTVGNVSKKQQHLANVISDGYVNHLEELKQSGFCRRVNSKFNLPKGSFGLCNYSGFCGIRLRKKTRAARTVSCPFSSAATTPRLSNKSHNQSPNFNVSSTSTLNSFVSFNHSPTSNTSNLFSNLFHNRANSKKSKQ